MENRKNSSVLPHPDKKIRGGIIVSRGDTPPRLTRAFLEGFYGEWNRPQFIHPDPLEFVLRFSEPADQEVAGLVASSLAFGQVRHILKVLGGVFRVLPNPAADIERMSRADLVECLRPFRHRWVSGEELADLLHGVRRVRGDYGSLENFFRAGLRRDDKDVVLPLGPFVDGLKKASGRECPGLLPCPGKGSPCKRLMLYMRWMVRKDAVDPGPWTGISPAMLIVPLDTHMFRIGKYFGLTNRGTPDMKSALEITRFFRSLLPGDPVRYDFSLTRPGIRKEPLTPVKSGADPATGGSFRKAGRRHFF